MKMAFSPRFRPCLKGSSETNKNGNSPEILPLSEGFNGLRGGTANFTGFRHYLKCSSDLLGNGEFPGISPLSEVLK